MKMGYTSRYFYISMILLSIYLWYLILLPLETFTLQKAFTFSQPWWGAPAEPPPRRFGYFLHITDMHIDESYLAGATTDSDCHRSPKPYELQRSSSSPLELAGKLGSPMQKCDSPIELAQKTLDWIKKEWKHKLNFVVWTGDNARHDWDDQRRRKRKHIYQLNEKIQEMMVETFQPTADDPRYIPLVPSLGNNDIHPHNYIGGVGDDHGILSFYSQLWHSWIPQEHQATFQTGGYFSVDVDHKLRVISLNTLYFYTKNDAVRGCHRPGLAQRHMQWFEQELVKARKQGIKVYVMGHVPPSPRDYRSSCFQEYTRISATYPDVLRGHFYGHLNMDHFLLFDGRETPLAARLEKNTTTTTSSSSLGLDEYYDDKDDESSIHDDLDDEDMCINKNIGKYVDWLRNMYSSLDPLPQGEQTPMETPLVVIQVSPSVLPVYLPSIRIYRYEINDQDDDHGRAIYPDHRYYADDDQQETPAQSHGTLINYKQYFANITAWEEEHNGDMTRPLEYKLEYDTHEAYGMNDLTVESYYQLAKDMVEEGEDEDDDRNALWSKFIENMFVQTLNSDPSIDK